jgi:hypothetical protein
MLVIHDMTEHDMANLRFLLEVEDLGPWYDQADEDDFAYARELLQKAETALELVALEIHDEAEATPESNDVWTSIIAQIKGEVKPPVGQKGRVKRWK